jgi:hypothetical protein
VDEEVYDFKEWMSAPVDHEERRILLILRRSMQTKPRMHLTLMVAAGARRTSHGKG